MAPIQFVAGAPLFVEGKVALHADCCCGDEAPCVEAVPEGAVCTDPVPLTLWADVSQVKIHYTPPAYCLCTGGEPSVQALTWSGGSCRERWITWDPGGWDPVCLDGKDTAIVQVTWEGVSPSGVYVLYVWACGDNFTLYKLGNDPAGVYVPLCQDTRISGSISVSY